MNYYLVKYSGPFGFIKPWTAVRDSETFSQQFLTPSIVEGLRQKLGVKTILRHKLTYNGITRQQEVTHTRGWNYQRAKALHQRYRSILIRGLMLNPILWLAFEDHSDAEKAIRQHICLCRNEDILLPEGEVLEVTERDFNKLSGFELRFEENERSFLVGFDRFKEGEPMYGWLDVTGNPLRSGTLL
jgi:hypothetical protein